MQEKEKIRAEFRELKDRFRIILDHNSECVNSGKEGIEDRFFETIPQLHALLLKDVDATFNGDPAATNKSEVIRTYPGFYAISAYRISHQLFSMGINLIPRIISEHAHRETGIDIHPGASIGESLCIDHGTGIVIGETTEIGNHVKIYQGVTLGGLSVKKEDASIKRHPTIEDNVVIYAGATILGGKTVIGKNTIIGGNVWLTSSVPAGSKVYYTARMTNTEGETDTVTFKQ
jgi:serine O-acetyltransferase